MFGKMEPNAIAIYNTDTFTLQKKQKIKVQDVKEFSFSPSDPYISYWTPEDGEKPARLVVMELPARREVAVKALYNVKECKMFWQKNGDHLGVQVTRYTKSKKATVTSFDLFHIREKVKALISFSLFFYFPNCSGNITGQLTRHPLLSFLCCS